MLPLPVYFTRTGVVGASQPYSFALIGAKFHRGDSLVKRQRA